MKVVKLTYEHFTLYSVSHEKPLSWDELYKVKTALTDEWCCMYFPPKKDYVDNAHEYHFFTCKEPDIHLSKGLESSSPLAEDEITLDYWVITGWREVSKNNYVKQIGDSKHFLNAETGKIIVATENSYGNDIKELNMNDN